MDRRASGALACLPGTLILSLRRRELERRNVDMTVFAVTLAPYLETLLTTDGLISGRTNRICGARRRMMGGGIAAGRVLERMGLDVRYLGILGRDNAPEMVSLLGDRAGESGFVETKGRSRERIFLRAGGASLRLEHPAPAWDRHAFARLQRLLCSALQPGDAVMLCGGFPQGWQNEPGCEEQLAGLCRRIARLGGRVAVDGVFQSLGLLHYARPSVVLLTQDELERLTGVKANTPVRLRAVMAMAAGNDTESLLVPRGVGALAALCGGTMRLACRHETALDHEGNPHLSFSVGGELSRYRMLAGYTAALAQNQDEAAGLELACACAAPQMGRRGRWGLREIQKSAGQVTVKEWRL